MDSSILTSYANFDEEQQMIEEELDKKADNEELEIMRIKEFGYRTECIKGYFLRLSWQHKKQFLLSIIKNMESLPTILRIMGYISRLYGKIGNYASVSPYSKVHAQQVTIDHDRSMEYQFMEKTGLEYLIWIQSRSNKEIIVMLLDLIRLAGGGLTYRLYIPIVNIYNKKITDQAGLTAAAGQNENKQLESILFEPKLDDSDKYPQNHPLSIEVQKVEKKWNDTIEKHIKDVFGLDRKALQEPKTDKQTKKKTNKKEKATTNKKEKKKGGGSKPLGDTIDWIQLLPIWIVKKILDHFDTKTLQNLKKVNIHWSNTCDSLIKDRQAAAFLDQTIKKMTSNVDPDILKECRQTKGFHVKTPDSPREKKSKKLMNRGAVVEEVRPKAKASMLQSTCLLTSLPKDHNIGPLVSKLEAFPRLIKEDLLLYKNYPCNLKDTNIIINVDESIKQQRATLSYTLSQQLSDTFSLSQANLADW